MATEPVEILITAKDETSRVLDQVRTKFTGFGQEMQGVERTGGQAFEGLGRNLERLAISFTRTLDPALGATVSRFGTLGTSLSRVAGLAGTAGTVLGVGLAAGVAVGTLALSHYADTLSRTAQEQAKTNRLLAEMDFGGLVARAKGLTGELDQLKATTSVAQIFKNAWVGALDEINRSMDRLSGGAVSEFLRRFGTDQAAIARAEQARAREGAAITELVPREIARVETRGRILGFQTGGELAGLQAQQALAERNIAAFLAEMDRREQALSNELTERERLIVQEGETRLAAVPPEARPAIEADIRRQREALGQTAAFDQLRRQRRAGAEQIGFALAAGEEDLSRVAPIAGTEADAVLAERQRAADLAQLDILRQRAALLGEITPELNAQLILTEAQLLKGQAGLTLAEQAAIDARAQLAILEEMAALDPLQGLIRGFSEASTGARRWGDEMFQVAREVNQNISRTFSDGLFNLFTGRKGEDLGKQFRDGLLRSLTDLAGRQLSGAVSGLLENVFRSVRGVVPGAAVSGAGGGGFDLLSLFSGAGSGGAGGAVISPTGLPAGTVVMTQAGLGQITPSGAVQLLQSSGGGGGVIGGDTVIGAGQALYGAYTGFSSLATNYAIGGVQGVLFGLEGATVGGATVLGSAGTTGFLAAEVGATGTGTAVGASGGTAGLAGSGGYAAAFSGAAGAASGVLAGVALGFTIYSGLYQEPTALNIAINAISGAVSGAVLGAVIGTFINPGLGTLIGAGIGALVGGAAAGSTTGLKAGGKKASASERSEAVAQAAAGNLSGAIDSAASIEDLVAIFNTRWSPHGETQILTTYQGITYWAGDWDDPPGALATPELMIIPEFLDALEIQVGQTGAPRHRQDLIDKFRAKRDEILETLSNIPFGILESDRAAGVTRRTYLPFQQLYGIKAGTQQLIGSSEFYRRDLGGEDDTIDFLIDRIRERSIRRDVDLTRDEFLFR